MRHSLALVLATSLLLSLAGCGKAGRPVAPPDSVYPRIYPNKDLRPSSIEQKDGRALPPEWDQQDLKDRFTKNGSYIDPSANVDPSTARSPTSATGSQIQGTDPFSKGLGSTSQSQLQQQQLPQPVQQPEQPSAPSESEDQP